MLASLHIKNIALIKELTVEFSGGLNVLSGETGAGKSILIDSIDFILGGRADKTLIRYGENSASVEAVFTQPDRPEVTDFFEENGIETDGTLILRRVMSADNKNECRINGRLVNLFTLKKLTSLLADICGQNEHQTLLKPGTHIAVIDKLSSGAAPLKKRVSALADAHSELKTRLDAFGDAAYRTRRLEILEYQIDEIKAAKLKGGEEDELKVKRQRLNNTGRLTQSVGEAHECLDGGEENAAALISRALSALNSAGSLDAAALELADGLSELKSRLNDILRGVNNFLESLNYDESEADSIENRLEELKLLKKKYGSSVSDIFVFLKAAEDEYDALKDAENSLSKLTKERDALTAEYLEAAKALSVLRKKTAAIFEVDIKRELSDMSMSGTTFSAAFETALEPRETLSRDGLDRVEFLISPNAGEPLRPLAKIISGGETSRFMLALKTIAAGADGVDVMIFDEIDTGISGLVAETVAEKLSAIARGRQVLAVTHLSQLASFADSHFLISKSVSENKTSTSVRLLNREESIAEIARLSGGSGTSLALPHARNIKEKADGIKAGKSRSK